ncbi:hypothetical protein [Magnetospirillum moscoviense]|nr:hypothetical protein [Magnetospirillum moscoviense]MBF0323809.1 hypothetical protein [Alphaproteobacteria bacterium]
MFRFIDVAPRVDPSNALLIGIAVVIGGALLFGLMIWLAKRLAQAGRDKG